MASRACLPLVLSLPHEVRLGMAPGVRTRYVWYFSGITEHALYIALTAALGMAIVGLFPRVSCLVAGVLLYHFAPLEDAIIGAPGPYARGLTVDVLALCILGFAPPEKRWPTTLIRAAVASQYVFSTIAKLRVAGLGWFTGANMVDMSRTFDLLGAAPWPLDSVLLGWIVALGWLAITLGMAATPFSRRARMIVVPFAALAHVLAIPLFGVVWLAAPLLLVFVAPASCRPSDGILPADQQTGRGLEAARRAGKDAGAT